MPTLSIIVPVYNVERYLKDCLDSILSQTLLDFELILVDDGSTDNSGKICEDYRARDERICIIHQKNQGISAARNSGIDIAKGEYITFVDSDDYIESTLYEKLVHMITKTKTDIATCGYQRVTEDSHFSHDVKNNCNYEEYIFDCNKCAKDLFTKDDLISVAVWNKIYRKSIFNALRFPVGKIYEDTYIIMDILSKCDKIYVTTETLYNYRIRSGSITQRPYRSSNWEYFEAIDHVCEVYRKYFPDYLDYPKTQRCKYQYVLLGKMMLANDPKNSTEIDNLIADLKPKTGYVISRKEVSLLRKISAIALCINKHIFALCVRLQNRENKQ